MDNLKYIKHFKSLHNMECNIFDINLKDFLYGGNKICESCQKCKFQNTHLYGCYEAQRWDNKYIYYCPMGFIFIAITIITNLDTIDYGIVSGPVIMGETEEFGIFTALPRFSTKQITDITEIMTIVFGKMNDLKNKHDFATTDVILNEVYKTLENAAIVRESYPIDLEKKLGHAIIEGNKPLSKELLNKLLGRIFFSSNSDLKIIKSRVLELIVLLSRSAIEGGADVNQIFALKDNYINEVENFTTLEKLSIWLTGVINRFISYVFEFNDVKHTDIIYKVTGYIKTNYKEKISLEDIAKHVYLSKSYLSKIFKEEMKCNLTHYINQMRIEKSKPLLLDQTLSLIDVANLTGFDDQSYFTKVFKNVTGVSPGKFREKHGKL
jgi:AraC-like DNA-binding protein/ligand-binding sensor protein